MQRIFLALVALLAVLSLAACGMPEARTVKPYQPVRATIGGDRSTLFSGVSRYAHEQGWEIVLEDATRGVLMTRTPPVATVAETEEREVWNFFVDPGEVIVSRRIEMRFAGTGAWVTAEVVCVDYAYAVESIRLGEIRDGIGSNTLVAKR